MAIETKSRIAAMAWSDGASGGTAHVSGCTIVRDAVGVYRALLTIPVTPSRQIWYCRPENNALASVEVVDATTAFVRMSLTDGGGATDSPFGLLCLEAPHV